MPDEQDQEPAETEELPPVRAGTEDAQFAENVRDARTRLRLSQGEVARRMSELGWSWYQQTVRRVESGERKATIGEAKALARILQTTVELLTMSSPKANAAALLMEYASRAAEAWDQIAEWTAALASAQRQLATTVPEAEEAGLADDPEMGRLLAEARKALAYIPQSAVADGLEHVQEGMAYHAKDEDR